MADRSPSPIHLWNDETQQFEFVGYGEHVYSPLPIQQRLSPEVFVDDSLSSEDDDEVLESPDTQDRGWIPISVIFASTDDNNSVDPPSSPLVSEYEYSPSTSFDDL